MDNTVALQPSCSASVPASFKSEIWLREHSHTLSVPTQARHTRQETNPGGALEQQNCSDCRGAELSDYMTESHKSSQTGSKKICHNNKKPINHVRSLLIRLFTWTDKIPHKRPPEAGARNLTAPDGGEIPVTMMPACLRLQEHARLQHLSLVQTTIRQASPSWYSLLLFARLGLPLPTTTSMEPEFE